MTPSIDKIITLATAGNSMADNFCQCWLHAAHACDDIVDSGISRQDCVKVFSMINMLYTHPFYVEHSARLCLVVQLVLNQYADSVEWEGSRVEWQKQWADTLRFAGNEMICAVAFLCGGWDRMRSVSQLLRTRSWIDHHDEQNNI